MITFIYGTYGSGKTYTIAEAIKKDIENGIRVFLIVPDQEVVGAEHMFLKKLPATAQLSLEILSFSRLYNRVCREYGGLSYRYLTKPMRSLLMWQNLRELAPLLEAFTGISDKDTSASDIMLSAIGECKASAITAQMLEKCADELKENKDLSNRLRDLALIYASYDNLVSENYSDSADDISRLYTILKKEKFFKNTNVYIDSFTSFTGAEHNVIERIFADADNVTVTIPLAHPELNDISTKSIKASQKKLLLSAGLHGRFKEIILHGNKRAVSPVLAYISENLWRLDISGENKGIYNDGSITMEICDTAYSEAEAVANEILRLLHKGERCRDMLVLMREPISYKGIIEPAFEKNGIPYYFSEKTDISSLPPIKLLFSALRIMLYNWQKNDIISHLKTGLYDLPLRSCDLFEDYITTWNLHGKRFCQDDDWTMNPDGYSDRITERGKDILKAANEVRKALTSTLEGFFIQLKAANTVPDMCRAVYSYFVSIELENRLLMLSAREAKQNNLKKAKELQAIYKIMLDALADIATALPDTSATPEEFALMLRTVLNESELGTIPTSMDEVVIGSAATLRAQNPKYTFVLGLCDGEFPVSIKEKGVFSSVDKKTLSEAGIILSGDSDTLTSNELMYAQRAFASPSHGLFLYTSASEFSGKAKNPSIPFNRVQALLNDYVPHRFSGNNLKYGIGAPRAAAMHLKTLSNTLEGNTLLYALTDHINGIDRISMLPISANEITLSMETTEKALKRIGSLSSTKFEKYVKCPLSFYCTYVLHLRENKTSVFLNTDMGTFVHAILEKLVGFAVIPDENGRLPTDDEIVKKTEAAVSEYIDKISPTELKRSGRLSHIYKRLKDLAIVMVRNVAEEFANSDFVPEFFELSIDGKEGNPPLMQFIHNDGYSISFSGQIDRVDVYRTPTNTYIRVVDYKTGEKTFSLDDVEHGINTQMLLYLFMLCKSPDSEFNKKLKLTDGQAPLPAGIMYLSTAVPTLQSDSKTDDRETMENLEKKLLRSGLLLSDEDVLCAMNHQLSQKFLAGIRKNKKGEINGKALTSAERFEELYEQIYNTVLEVTKELRRGTAGASPLKYGDTNACDYCKMKSICRKEGSV